MEKAKSIAITGASGFVGSHLCSMFKKNGWGIIPLGRKEFASTPEKLAQIIEGVDVIVNLAGAPVVGRWSEKYKKILYDSRVTLTNKLINACKLLETPPSTFLSVSAAGCYTADGSHTEENNVLADDFLGNLTRDWEHEALKAKELGSRTTIFRFGIVLGKGGGVLGQMLLPFKLGLGGTIGDGSQALSWIHITDLVRIFEEAITDSTYEGIYNLTAPHPTTNLKFTKALGKALSRPTILPVPVFLLRLVYGDGAQVITSGQTALPQRLLDRGFQFDFPFIDEAVADCVK